MFGLCSFCGLGWRRGFANLRHPNLNAVCPPICARMTGLEKKILETRGPSTWSEAPPQEPKAATEEMGKFGLGALHAWFGPMPSLQDCGMRVTKSSERKSSRSCFEVQKMGEASNAFMALALHPGRVSDSANERRRVQRDRIECEHTHGPRQPSSLEAS